jgi:hypothetical protein
MEHMILQTLNFDISTATISWFVERLVRHAKLSEVVKNLALVCMVQSNPLIRHEDIRRNPDIRWTSPGTDSIPSS